MSLTAADASLWATTLATLVTVWGTLRAQDKRPTPRDERKLREQRDKARREAAASRRREELANRRARAAEAQLRARGVPLTDEQPALAAAVPNPTPWPRGTGRRRLPTGALPAAGPPARPDWSDPHG